MTSSCSAKINSSNCLLESKQLLLFAFAGRSSWPARISVTCLLGFCTAWSRWQVGSPVFRLPRCRRFIWSVFLLFVSCLRTDRWFICLRSVHIYMGYIRDIIQTNLFMYLLWQISLCRRFIYFNETSVWCCLLLVACGLYNGVQL